jgi:hypothetical protein
MGYECCYKYHEKVEGDYNKEEVKTFKKKVGDPFEDVPLNKLATVVMAQLARRDIWIIDVEILELSKKPISFRETKNGIIIKNKKFSFDLGEESTNLIEEDVEEAKPSSHPHQLSQQVRQGGEWVVFSPEIQDLPKVKNLKLTVDKKYAVLGRKSGNFGDNYIVLDDAGKEQVISELYFVPANVNLIADRELGFSSNNKKNENANLFWGNSTEYDSSMPELRKK